MVVAAAGTRDQVGIRGRIRALRQLLRPVHPDVERAMAARWDALPAEVKTPAQMLGQRFLGCEGTHGVFPKCNLSCAPCYHSREANAVPVDPAHTSGEVAKQMAYLRELRGPGQHAQLIGGEVTLLGPEGHADVLGVMQAHGRKPMSMTHGDFDYDYLVALAVDVDGRRRFDHVSFAVHIDTTMAGRRGTRKPVREADLHPERRRVSDMFTRLRREYGVRSYLAHNMTVTPANLGDVADVVSTCRGMGYRMLAFQPAAAVGNRRVERTGMSDDAVWAEIERGAGVRLTTGALQVGDPRCNRTVWGIEHRGGYTPLLDDRETRDLRARDLFLHAFPGFDFGGSRTLLGLRMGRVMVRHPAVVPAALAWAIRTAGRAGIRQLVRGVRPLTFVMHSFMDANVVAPAWDLIQRGVTADDPDVRAAQVRLQACSYLMAHPERDQLVPACAQHAVFEPGENERLRILLGGARPPDRTPTVSS